MPDARRQTQLANYSGLGVTFVRFDLDWAGIQPTNSTTYNWTYFDKIINAIVAEGMKPLPILHRCPSWAGTGVPTSMATFGTFCTAAVNRYKDRVKHWEVWNEPNLAGFWPPNPNPVSYTNMLKAAYPAIKGADPTSTVISAGLAAVPYDTNMPAAWSARDFVTQIYANGGGPFFDALGFHPYAYPLSVTNTDDWNGWPMMSTSTPNLRGIMTANGDSAKKIWMTEFGGPTGSDTNAITDTALSTMVSQAHTAAAGFSWAGPLIWYEYWDGGTNPGDQEQNFGLVKNDYTIKPAYNTYLHLKSPAANAFSKTLQQGTASYASAVDTRVNQAAATTAYGTAASLTIGGATGTTDKSQALLRFDNLVGSGTNQIPANAAVISAEVQLNITTAGHGPSFHRMLQTWAATDTWNSRTAGVSRDGVEAANNAINGDYWQEIMMARFSVTSDVQAWVNGASNFGWLLEPTRESPMTFDSSEAATVANRPKLLVSYIV